MTTANLLTEMLAAPLGPDWTIDRLAEDLLAMVAERDLAESDELVIDSEVITDRQTLRLMRPLIACLDTKSATEAGTLPNLYGGSIAFHRPGPEGPVWISGQFENTPGSGQTRIPSNAHPDKISRCVDGSTGRRLTKRWVERFSGLCGVCHFQESGCGASGKAG